MRLSIHTITAVGLFAFGAAAMNDPRKAARQYGLPTGDKTGLTLVRALGARDIALGALLLGCAKSRRAPLAAIAFVGICDFFAVSSTSDEPSPKSLGLHGAGFLAALSYALFAKDED